MKTIPKMVDMARSPEEKQEEIKSYTSPQAPTYPYGLCISLCEDELDKLNLDDSDAEVGDMVHLHALAVVTSVSKNSSEFGDHRRIELQLRYISVEGEDEENEDVEEEEVNPLKKLYK